VKFFSHHHKGENTTSEHSSSIYEPKTSEELAQFINSRSKDELTIFDFYATWCHSCKAVDPVFKNVEREHRNTIKCVKINVDHLQDAVIAMSVTAMPTFVAMKGSSEFERVVGPDPVALLNLAIKLENAKSV
jgi:thioredoxin 1